MFLKSHTSELVGDAQLYLPKDIVERNQTYETLEYTPGYINIGDDGGGRAFVIKLIENNPKVFAIDHGSMDVEDKESVCSSFTKWVEINFVF